PGEEAQVDWGYFGRVEVFGVQRHLWCFAMVLSWSRMLYIEFVWETHEAVLQRCHMNAFDYFQGVPKRILYDNMKTVAIGRREDGQVQWNTKFLDFAQHYGFQPRVHRPRSPKTKGKVERPMGYIRGNFFQGLSFSSLRDLNAQARTWLEHVANVRVHGTTREVPFVRWQERERSALRSITVPPYDTSIVSRRKVSRDGFVVVRTNRYSVPWQFAGQWLVTRETPDGWLEILDGDEVVAVHPLLPERQGGVAGGSAAPRIDAHGARGRTPGGRGGGCIRRLPGVSASPRRRGASGPLRTLRRNAHSPGEFPVPEN